MGKIVTIDNQGRIIYEGLLSHQEIASIDEIIKTLQEEIPEIEASLKELYGSNVWYKYYLGLFLGNLLEKYEITVVERRKFWDEIKNLATEENRIRDEGVNSATRSFYQQCYILSLIDKEAVGKLTWRQWSTFLDRIGIREDERIFMWLKQYPDKINQDDWRAFEKALHLYLKTKDTSVFDLEELYEIYDSIMLMCQIWRIRYKQFKIDHPKSAKIEKWSNWQKYFTKCYELRKEQKYKYVNENICNTVFTNIMEY